jgi:hypothetical protein
LYYHTLYLSLLPLMFLRDEKSLGNNDGHHRYSSDTAISVLNFTVVPSNIV